MKRYLSCVVSAFFILLLPICSFADDYGEKDLIDAVYSSFSAYSATRENPSVPNGFNGSMNGKGIIYAGSDEQNQNYLIIEDPYNTVPWISTKNLDVQDGKVRVYFDLKPMFEAGSTQVKLFADSGNADILRLYENGKIKFYGVSADTAVSEEVYNKYALYETDKWYSFCYEFDLDNRRYSVSVNNEPLASDIEIPIGFFRSVRYSVNAAGNMVALDNIRVCRLFDMPKVVSANYNEALNNISVEFNKDMDADSFENIASLELGQEKVSIPFTAVYENRGYTLTPVSPLISAREYTLILKSGIKCTDGGALTEYKYSFKTEFDGITPGEAAFSLNSGTAEVLCDIYNNSANDINIVTIFAAYSGDIMLKSALETYTVSTGAIVPIDMSISGVQNADGAALYITDLNFTPLCEYKLMQNSAITSGLRGSAEEFANKDYNIADNEIRVFGKVTPGELVTVISALGENITQNSVFSSIRQTTAKENGYYEIIFKNNEDVFLSDDYCILVKTNSNSILLPYKYSNNPEAATALVSVNMASSADDIKAAISSYKKVFALEMQDYESVNCDNVCRLIFNEIKNANMTTGAEFTTAFNRAVCIEMINSGRFNNREVLADYAAEFGISGEITALMGRIMAKSEIVSFNNFFERFEEARMLSEISYSKNANTLKNLLTNTYADKIPLFLEEQTSIRYAAINEKTAVYNAMLNMEYETTLSVQGEFSEAVMSVYKRENKNPGGGGGSSGGIRTGALSNDAVKNTVKITTFSDVDEANLKIVGYLAAQGIICGDGNGKFRPNDNVAREEMVKMLVTALKLGTEGLENSFVDVNRENWAYPYISAMEKYGAINGIGENKFGIGGEITRQDAMTIIYRIAKKENLLIFAKDISDMEAAPSDIDEASDYARKAVLFVSENILDMKGKRVNPKISITRMETAELLYNFLKLKGGAE